MRFVESKLQIVQYQHVPLAIGIKGFRGDRSKRHTGVPVREKSLLVELSSQRVAGGGLAVGVGRPSGKEPVLLSGKVGALLGPSREDQGPPGAALPEEVSCCPLNARGQRTFMPRTEMLGVPVPPGCDNGCSFSCQQSPQGSSSTDLG